MTTPDAGSGPAPESLAWPPDRMVGPASSQGRDLTLRRNAPLQHPRATAAPPTAVATKLDAVALLKALRHRWKLALCLGLLCGGLAVPIAWFAMPRSQYTAKALLKIASKQPSIIFRTAEDQVDFPTYQRTQLTLIKSRLVLNAALRDSRVSKLGLVTRQADPIAWLEKQIRASFDVEILTISMSDKDPNSLPDLVNAVTDAYLNEIVNVDAEDRRKRFDELKEIYNEYQTKSEQRKKILDELAKQLGSNDTATVRLAHQLALESRSMLQRELMQIRMDLRRAETELKVRQESRGEGTTTTATTTAMDSVIEGYVAQDEFVQDCQRRIARLESAAAQAERIARKKNDPAVLGPLGELADLRRQLADRQAQLRSWYARQLQAGKLQAGNQPGRDRSLSSLLERVRILRELEKATAHEVDSLSDETQDIRKNSMELERIQKEIASADSAAKRVGDEVEALNVELNAPCRVRLIEKADAPRLEADKRTQMAGMAGLGAFGLAVLTIAFVEYRARRLGSADEVVRELGMPLVGTVPALPDRARLPWRGWNRTPEESWSDLLVESIDATRTTLLHASAVDSVRAIMITSALGGEGKTSLSCHLATSLARAGLRTVLLDADLRRPTAHLLFDLAPEPGFSELLRGEITLDEALQPTSATGLRMIPAGRSDPQTIQMLPRPVVGMLFKQLRERFDFIVVDTPPVLPVTDALLIGQHVDAAICSVLRGVSRIPQVDAANDRLLTLGIRILGVVMAGVDTGSYGSRYPCYRRAPGLGQE